MVLYCATSNPGKLHEFRMAAPFIEPFTGMEPCDETGSTFEENAIEKALYYSRHAPGLLFSDDSGLEVEALRNAPGIYTSRYAGLNATTQQNNDLLLRNLADEPNRKARYVCVVALADRGQLLRTFRAEVEGEILRAPQGSEGFGYDPLFFYPPFGKSFGQVSDAEKFLVSHRGKALTAMVEYVKSHQLAH